MKCYRSLLVLILLSLTACQKNSHDHDHGKEALEDSPNGELYKQVMAIHDEVMPKMDDLYKSKSALRTRLELPGVNENEKQEIRAKIARIDSASEGMMVWMRQFDPIPDSVDKEKARIYLEEELVKVKKVREDILEALKAAP